MGKRRSVREVSAGGVVYRRLADNALRFLLIRDSYDKWGLPKGHLEDGETPAEAALRETREEVGLGDLRLIGPIRIIDWHFRAKGGRLIHKFCHFFLLESPADEPIPQLCEGIPRCGWSCVGQPMPTLSSATAGGVLGRAGAMARPLTAVAAGRPQGHPLPRRFLPV